MNPSEDLMHEHKAIELMLNIMSKIASSISAQQQFDIEHIEKILDFIRTFADKCHHGKEETVLFPALVTAGIGKENGPIGVMLHDHELGRGYIKEIGLALDSYKSGDLPAANLIAENINNYVNLLRSHIFKENNILFPMADKVLDQTTQETIFHEFERIEEEVVGHGVHEKYHELLHKMKEQYLD